MDADVYGPSIPHLLGVASPTVVDNRIQPIVVDGMPVMSMGFLVPPGEAVVWRGPMLHGAITQFLRDTEWGPLDYLIIDMPPGTGDMAPDAVAIAAAHRRGRRLHAAGRGIAGRRQGDRHVPQSEHRRAGHGREHERLRLPGLRRRHDIFGSGGARQRAAELDVPFLGDVPIVMKYRELGDAGRVEESFRDPRLREPLDAICRQLVQNLATAARTQHRTAACGRSRRLPSRASTFGR